MKAFRALAIVSGLAISVPAFAQGIPVYDSSTFLQTLSTVKNTLSMIEQGKQQISQATDMFNSVNKLTNVNQIASSLNTDAVRHLLPSEARDIQRLMSSNTTGLGSLGTAADRIRSSNRVELPELRPDATAFERSNRDAISRNGDMAARDAAIAEAAYGVTAQRTTGLEELRSSLDTASDAKDVMDIQARVGVENAHIQNDAVQLQALTMRQQAEQRIRSQQESEQILASKLGSLHQ
ncbi:type IV secretion system protein VirB5 [Sphingobium fontiphilum]|jgi:type IV secretion system protein VirB5|uniref:Type IV secretion system protein VirB5 n=1 Tax=Sphingobium fontiphilum TaxID=944425 RepID=A0A7W6DKT5_9SPHN|nr:MULTISPECIES: type IV secretion system protein [Sphingobium]MBB3983201.1 type IV secretion system protein VirB5 [Sphingobium fontiphilum]WCP16039.1 Type IV secretion system protein virB5 [Sphingobium sp. AntQ-1]